MVPLIINVLVGWVIVASGGILNDQRSELLDSGLDIGPVVILDLLNEFACGVSQLSTKLTPVARACGCAPNTRAVCQRATTPQLLCRACVHDRTC